VRPFEPHPAEATIAIPTFNPAPAIFQEVLTRAASVGLPVLVVDMSTDGCVERACADADGDIMYDKFPQSRGVSQSRNRCVELAGTRRVIFLDSDAFPEEGWAAAMLKRLDESDIGVVGAKILPQWETPPPRLFQCHTAGLHLSLFDIGPLSRDVPRIIGTSYALDRTRVPSPPFDESIGRRPGWGLSGEENKLCVESRRMGFRVVYEPASVVFHHVSTARLRWRWMWSRAYSSGREQALTGREEALPHPALTWVDRAFKATIAIPFLAGKVRGVPGSSGVHGSTLPLS
jgi:glucosyl-dolichyl phosphate glucuronosyltransferase